MRNVSQATKEAYLTDGVHKNFIIVIDYRNTYTNGDIVDGSIELKQSIFDGDNFDICGCVSNSLSFKLYTGRISRLPQKNDEVQLRIQAADTEEMTLFSGFIDNCDAQAGVDFVEVTAYDIFYKISGHGGFPGEEDKRYDVTDWFNNQKNISISELLDSLLELYRIDKAENVPNLTNGNTVIRRKSENNPKVSSLSALDLFKDIFRFNGCFGYIDPIGRLGWKYLKTSPYDIQGELYPSEYLYPSNTLYPGVDSSQSGSNSPNLIGTYEKLIYRTYEIKPIAKVVVADYKEDKNKGEAGSGYNKYTIYGNVCALGESEYFKRSAAQSILNCISGLFYVPFESDGLGLPYFEPGDEIVFYDARRNTYNRTMMFSRTMKISQHMTDNFSATGDQYQREFTVGNERQVNEIEQEKIDEIQNEIDLVGNEIDLANDRIDDLDFQIDNVGDDLGNLSTDYDNFKTTTNAAIDEIRQQGLQANIKIVSEVPANPARDTLYLIKGDTMIL